MEGEGLALSSRTGAGVGTALGCQAWAPTVLAGPQGPLTKGGACCGLGWFCSCSAPPHSEDTGPPPLELYSEGLLGNSSPGLSPNPATPPQCAPSADETFPGQSPSGSPSALHPHHPRRKEMRILLPSLLSAGLRTQEAGRGLPCRSVPQAQAG